ncbi:MAG: PAS domain S-box protein [Candidatus Saccharibacteria bacterium]
MDDVKDNGEFKISEVIAVAELIRSPDIEVRQKAVENLARIALRAIQTDEGSEQFANVLLFDESDVQYAVNAERRIYDEKLRQTYDNYEAFFNTIDEFLFVLDDDGRIIHVNETVISRLGFSEDELFGESILSVHPLERRDEAGVIVSKMLAGTAKVCPVPIITKSGEHIPVETTIKAGFWDGKPALFGVTKDISRLKFSEEKFEKAFNLNPSVCGLSDVKTGEYVEVNPAFFELLGYTPEEAIGKSASQLGILNEDTIADIQNSANSDGSIINIETVLVAKNGDLKNVILSSENIQVQDTIYRYTIVNDITEIVKDEREIQLAREKYKDLVEKISDVIYTLDINGNFTYISPVIEEISHYREHELLGMSFASLIHPDDIDEMVEKFKITIDGAKEKAEFRVIDKNGDIHWVRTSSRVTIEDGKIRGITGLMVDITERKVLEEKLRKLSLYDSLTGLYSRNHLEEQIEILSRSRRYPISVINIDIDGLHNVNNNWGHDAGDELIKNLAQVLKEVFRQEDCVCRAGGDEFIIILPDVDNESVAYTIKRIEEAIIEQNKINLKNPLSISIGSATANNILDWDKSLKDADELMFANKKKTNSRKGDTLDEI